MAFRPYTTFRCERDYAVSPSECQRDVWHSVTAAETLDFRLQARHDDESRDIVPRYTMIPDPVETLLQARNADETTFRNLVRQLGAPGTLVDHLFDAALKAQLGEPDRARNCVQVIDRLRDLV